jgi:beta-1,4-mannosyl-glycoprotein beta-1,4-N-acetylglucosaminyltransferase
MPESYPPVLPTHRTHPYSGRLRIRRLRHGGRHLLFLGLPIIFLFLWFISIAGRDKWIRDFGYITRPIWDTSINNDRPQTIIPHYDVSEPSIPGELCALHGWSNSSSITSHTSPPKVYDAFLYSIELDLLEIRLHELWDVVDTFVILEATRSFSGDLRHDMTPLFSLLASPQARLNWASPKIQYELVDDLSPSPKDPFDNESHLRGRMDALLSSAGVRPNDIVLMSDLDEIPNHHTISLLKQCSDWPSPLHLQMKNYLYSFEFPLQDDGYWRPKAVRWGGYGSSYNHAKGGDVMLASSGWHCSWCFRYIEDIQFKMTVRRNKSIALSP